MEAVATTPKFLYEIKYLNDIYHLVVSISVAESQYTYEYTHIVHTSSVIVLRRNIVTIDEIHFFGRWLPHRTANLLHFVLLGLNLNIKARSNPRRRTQWRRREMFRIPWTHKTLNFTWGGYIRTKRVLGATSMQPDFPAGWRTRNAVESIQPKVWESIYNIFGVKFNSKEEGLGSRRRKHQQDRLWLSFAIFLQLKDLLSEEMRGTTILKSPMQVSGKNTFRLICLPRVRSAQVRIQKKN